MRKGTAKNAKTNFTDRMKISLLTVSFNSAATIGHTIESIRSQDYKNIEYIIVDGDSKDGTVEIVKSHEAIISKWISEPDHGIYDAMNKGIKSCTGDIIGILNSDDHYATPDVISRVAEKFEDKETDAVYGDLNYVNTSGKIIRKWRSGKYDRNHFLQDAYKPETARRAAAIRPACKSAFCLQFEPCCSRS